MTSPLMVSEESTGPGLRSAQPMLPRDDVVYWIDKQEGGA